MKGRLDSQVLISRSPFSFALFLLRCTTPRLQPLVQRGRLEISYCMILLETLGHWSPGNPLGYGADQPMAHHLQLDFGTVLKTATVGMRKKAKAESRQSVRESGVGKKGGMVQQFQLKRGSGKRLSNRGP